MKKLFDYNPMEVQKIVDEMKYKEDQLYYQRRINAQMGPQTQRPNKNAFMPVQCFHCGTTLDRLINICYEIVKYDNGVTTTARTFHKSCFEEVAGKGYIE